MIIDQHLAEARDAGLPGDSHPIVLRYAHAFFSTLASVDFSSPYRVITPTLEGPVLRALAGAEVAMTRSQILFLVEDASEAGIRKALARLVEQGIVTEERIGSRYTYEANRDHLLWPSVEGLLRVRDLLRERIRAVVFGWAIPPVSVELFGSVAHGGATAASDVDLLVLRPDLQPDESDIWDDQICDLQDQLFRWTGNYCDVLVLAPAQFAAAVASDEPVLRSGLVNLAGLALADVRRDLGAESTPPQAWRAAALTAATDGLAARFSTGLTEAAASVRAVASIAALLQDLARQNRAIKHQLRQAGAMVSVQTNLEHAARDVKAAQRKLELGGAG